MILKVTQSKLFSKYSSIIFNSIFLIILFCKSFDTVYEFFGLLQPDVNIGRKITEYSVIFQFINNYLVNILELNKSNKTS